MENKEQGFTRESEAEIRSDYADTLKLESGEYNVALAVAFSTQMRAHESRYPLLEAEATTQIGRIYHALSKKASSETEKNDFLDRAEFYGYKAAIIAFPTALTGKNTALPVPLTFLGGILEERGRLEAARIVYQEAVHNPLPSNQDPAYRNETLVRLYSVEFMLGVRTKESMIEESEKAIEDNNVGLVTVKDTYAKDVWISGSYLRMAKVLLDTDPDQALVFLLKARSTINENQKKEKYNKQLNFTQRQEDWWNIAEKLPINIASLYQEAQKKRDEEILEPARVDYKHISAMAERNGEIRLSLQADQMIGIILDIEDKYEEEKDHLHTVLQRAEKAGDIVTQGDICRDIGWAYYRLGDLENAELLLQRSVDLLLPTENVQNYGISFIRLCTVQSERYTLQNAISPIEQTLQIMQASRGKDKLPTYYEFNGTKWLCTALINSGEYEKAQDVYERAMQMKKQIEIPENKHFVSDTRDLEELWIRIQQRS